MADDGLLKTVETVPKDSLLPIDINIFCKYSAMIEKGLLSQPSIHETFFEEIYGHRFESAFTKPFLGIKEQSTERLDYQILQVNLSKTFSSLVALLPSLHSLLKDLENFAAQSLKPVLIC